MGAPHPPTGSFSKQHIEKHFRTLLSVQKPGAKLTVEKDQIPTNLSSTPRTTLLERGEADSVVLRWRISGRE